MQAGRNRSRVTILNKVVGRTPSGQPKEEWQSGLTVWAEVKGISGREIVTSGAEKPEATIRVWMRFRTDVTAASRLKVINGPLKGQVLDVTAPPIPDSKGKQLEILCKQGVKI